MLFSTGANAEGYRELLGMQVSTVESRASWKGFFHGLKARGLNEVYWVTSDAHLGVQHAIGDGLTECVVAAVPHPFFEEPVRYGVKNTVSDVVGNVSHDFLAAGCGIGVGAGQALPGEIPACRGLPGRSLG